MDTLSLLHHTPATCNPGYLVTERMPDAPAVTEAMEIALRRVVLDHRSNGSEPTRWHHGEGWSAVMDLHRAGHHEDALDLALLLHWCDSQHNGQEVGVWEIVRGDPSDHRG